jgi:L-threonylcarbamoyladenylate synthase
MGIENDIENCLSILKAGGVILYPTDTVWGLGCDATNEQAVAKVYAIKQRAESKSLIILLAKENDLDNYCKQPTEEILQLIKNTERPLTIVYPNAKNLGTNTINEDGTIAIRIPKNDFCQSLLNLYNKPIVSTSANISGEPTATIFKEINTKIVNAVDYVCVHRQDEVENTMPPSKIIKWNNDNTITIIRP